MAIVQVDDRPQWVTMHRCLHCGSGFHDAKLSAGSRNSRRLELPVLINTLDRPIELLTQSLGEEAFDGDIELLCEHDGQARVDVVLFLG
jgi:hypothetical protein